MTRLPAAYDNGAPDDGLDIVSMDPAQQSLADALRITFRLLQFVMVLLVVLFLGSGFQTVGESERGVKLVFGKVVQDDVPPGVTWNWPFPIGELVKVRTGQQSIEIDKAFAPDLGERDRTKSLVSVLPRLFKLDPAATGSVITADGAVAHTWWRIVWRRQAPAENVRSIVSDDENRLVSSAVQRAVVRAVAEISIDQLLKQGSTVSSAPAPVQPALDGQSASDSQPPAQQPQQAATGDTSLELRVRSMAQQTLDALASGIIIDQVILAEKSPPGNVIEAFSSVNNAETQAARSREDAEKKAREVLNGAAGEAHPALLDLIDDYERQLELGDAGAASKTFSEIERVLDGGRVAAEGRDVTASGEVTSIISEARQYRTDVVSSAQALAAQHEAKLPAFKASPAYFVASEWGNAYQEFLFRNRAERFFIPSGALAPEVWLNRDPEIKRREEIESGRERASTSLKTLSERRSQEFWREQRRVRDEKEEQRRLERERKKP